MSDSKGVVGPQPGDAGVGSPSFNTASYYCVTCFISKPLPEFPANVAGTCQHKPSVCFECVERMFKYLIAAADLKKITCPECFQPLTKDDVKRFLSKEQFER